MSGMIAVLGMVVCEAGADPDRPLPTNPSVDSPGVADALPEEIEPGRPLQLEVDILDGSRIVGTPSVDTVRIQTSHYEVDVPLERIISMTVEDDRKTIRLALRNGDEISGEASLEAIEVNTLFGDVTIGFADIKELRVISNDGTIPAFLKQSMALHYSFDGDRGDTVKDQSANGNNGTIHNAKLVDDARVGKGLKLDGENSYVHIPNSKSLEIREELTVCTWVKLDSFGPGGYGNEHGFIISKGDSMWWNPAFHLGYSKGSGSGEPRWPGKPGPYPALFHVGNSTGAQNGGGKTIESETLLHTGKWYHIAGTYDGEQVNIYINGEREGTAEYTGLLRGDLAPVFIGGSKLGATDWGNQFTTDVTVGEVMIFNKALTDAEIQIIYRANNKG